MCAIEDGDYRRDKIDFWDSVYGFNMRVIKDIALTEPLVSPPGCGGWLASCMGGTTELITDERVASLMRDYASLNPFHTVFVFAALYIFCCSFIIVCQ